MFVQIYIYKNKLNSLIEKYPDFIEKYKIFNPKYEDGKRISITKKLYLYLINIYPDFEEYFIENFKKDDTEKKEYINNYVKNKYKTDEEYKNKMDERKNKSLNKIKDEKNIRIKQILNSVNMDKKSYIRAMVYINKVLLKVDNEPLKNLLLEIKNKTMENEDNIDELFNIKDLHININKNYRSYYLDYNDDWKMFLQYIQQYRFSNIDNCKTTKFNYVLIDGFKSLMPYKDIEEFKNNGKDVVILSEYP